ncbi:LysR family transcriptional regulator [Paraburkholderia caledonica]|uniref:DNA-binding transcriptional LysR family regulator n=1 Tax=Paraburkholderia caledonica TaxID=134536 RepID=A0ABU1KYW7_9BURK|nr:LysR family transcriptional regulator [Paraburkholderia caledonica]MDR6376155.1 DNA-binding transcriptional LysR family regulator [Paraburkholderia caledonica]
MDRLKALEVLKAVIDHAGFSRGAEAMNMSKSAATRLIQDFEQEMGARLLVRTTRKVALTAVGQHVYERATSVLHSYNELQHLCRENVVDASGQIVLEVPMLLGSQRLGPVIASFIDDNPRISVDVRISKPGDGALSDRGDVSIVVGGGIPETVVARPLAVVQMGLYASRRYIKAKGIPNHPADICPTTIVTVGGTGADQSLALSHEPTGTTHRLKSRGSFMSDHADALVNAAIYAPVVALVPCMSAEIAQKQGLLVPILTSWKPTPIESHLVYRSPRFQPLRVKKLIEHLVENLSKFDTRPTTPSATYQVMAPTSLRPNISSVQFLAA